MKNALYFALFFILVNCGKEKPGGIVRTAVPNNGVFTFSIDAVIRKDDALSLYYTTDGSIDFAKKPAIWIDVKGSSDSQKIVFSLEKGIVPTQLRIDLGKNPKQDDIYLHKVSMAYGGKSVEIPGTLIFSYFRPDVTKTKADATTGMVKGIVVDGLRRSPSLYPKEGPLSGEIKKLLR